MSIHRSLQIQSGEFDVANKFMGIVASNASQGSVAYLHNTSVISKSCTNLVLSLGHIKIYGFVKEDTAYFILELAPMSILCRFPKLSILLTGIADLCTERIQIYKAAFIIDKTSSDISTLIKNIYVTLDGHFLSIDKAMRREFDEYRWMVLGCLL